MRAAWIARIVISAAACVAVAVAAAPAAASSPPVTGGARYLALGDSVTFGYEEAQVVPAPDYANASSFIAYPELLGAELRLKVTNAACPGETSSSLINTRAVSNGCENSLGQHVGYRRSFPLHVRYRGSQLAYAVAYLRAHHDVRLVSLMIGANDLFVCQETSKDGCTSPAEQHALFAKVARNVHRILSAIRTTAGYRGQFVIVNYYSLNYASAFIDAAVSALNRTVDRTAKTFNVEIANGFREFRLGSVHSGGDPCKAGLLTQLSAGGCGVHPSYAGQSLLAQAVEDAIRL